MITRSQTKRMNREAPTTLPNEMLTDLIGPYMHHDCKEITANAQRCPHAFRYSYGNAKKNCSQYCVENATSWLPQLLATHFPTDTDFPFVYPDFEVKFKLSLTEQYDEKSFQESWGYHLSDKNETIFLPITDVYLYFHKQNGAYDKYSVYPLLMKADSPLLIYSEVAKQLQLAASDSMNPLVALELEIHTYFLTDESWRDWWDNQIDMGTIRAYNPDAAEITVDALQDTLFGLNKNWALNVQSPDEGNLPPWLERRAVFASLISIQ